MPNKTKGVFMFKLITIFMLMLSLNTFASEHQMTNISGTDVELKSYDHAIAGALNGFLIFGNINEEKGQSTLTIKKDGGISTTVFEKLANRPFGGKIILTGEKGTSEIEVVFKKLNRTDNIYTFSVNGEEIAVKVDAEDFINNHFINPKYSTTLKGKAFHFKIEEGGACYNMSAHLIAMMIGAASL